MEKFKWYAVHTLSQYEQKVKKLIENTKSKYNMDDYIEKIVIPVDTEVKKVDGIKKEKQIKVFPGYILVRMILDEKSSYFIKHTPGVTNFVSVSGKPVAMKDSEIHRILESLNPDKVFKPKKKWEAGMIVRISDGPFSDFTGKIENVNEQKETIVVSVSLFGRDTPVEIEFGKIEKVS